MFKGNVMAEAFTIPIKNGRNGKPTGVRGVRGCKPSTEEETPTTETDDLFTWDVGNGARKNYSLLGERLSAFPDLFRNGEEGFGLIQVLPSGQTRQITKAAELAPLIADRLNLVVVKNGRTTGDMPPAQHLNALLRSDVFLTEFRPVDVVARTPYYRADFTLINPGYNDGGAGRRTLYVGPIPEIADSTETIENFLGVMEFESPADATNAVAAALTMMLRHLWPGAKPLVLITASKSHAGKGTVTVFIQGTTPKADLLYESIDWPMQCQFQRQLKADPDIGLVVFDNVRLDSAGGRGKCIRSTFVESFITTAELTLASPGAGEPIRINNHYVVTINTNDGALSADLMNRALPIHLAPKGDTQERQSQIGNPKFEFLPQNRDRIDAELRGMIERWKNAGCPLDENFRHHPMPEWAQTIGGILKFNGFTNFLENRRTRRVQDDPIRQAIAILGSARPGEVLSPTEWAELGVKEGLTKALFTQADRDTIKGRERGIGIVLKRHLDETFIAEREDEGGKRFRLTLRLDGGYRRWEKGQNGRVRYVFKVMEKEEVLPVEA